jgi:hypothetical protein
MRSEVLTAMKMAMLVFWVATQCGLAIHSDVSEEHSASIFSAEGLCSMFLRKVGICTQVHTTLRPRRPTSTYCTEIFHDFLQPLQAVDYINKNQERQNLHTFIIHKHPTKYVFYVS